MLNTDVFAPSLKRSGVSVALFVKRAARLVFFAPSLKRSGASVALFVCF
jgi:hypothetical protein